jgi:hypothetical protein
VFITQCVEWSRAIPFRTVPSRKHEDQSSSGLGWRTEFANSESSRSLRYSSSFSCRVRVARSVRIRPSVPQSPVAALRAAAARSGQSIEP